MPQWSRKDFLKLSVALAGGAAVLGCGSGDCDSSTIADNHGHRLTIPDADIKAGAGKSYNIQGTAGHSHTVELSAAQMTQLSQGTSLTVTSSTTDLHSHAVTVVCA
jgi:hypothetical protein